MYPRRIWLKNCCAFLGTHGSTFGGNPLGSKVAMQALEILEEDELAENALRLGELFRVELIEKLKNANTVINDIRGKGLLNALDINRSKYLPNVSEVWQLLDLIVCIINMC